MTQTKTEKICGLRFEINVNHDADSNQFLYQLKNKMNQDLPKFKIHKIALDSNWQSASNFVCLVHTKKMQRLRPIFQMEFDGFTLFSSKNTQKVKFELALGKNTVVFFWNEESKRFMQREDQSSLVDSKPPFNLPEPQKKQKTAASYLDRNQTMILENLLEKFERKAIKHQEDMLTKLQEEKADRQQKEREELHKELNKRDEVLFQRLLHHKGTYSIQGLKAQNLQLRREKADLERQIKTLQVQQDGFQLNSKFHSDLFKQVENLKKELATEQKKNWLCDEQLNKFISELRKTNTGANLCETHCFEFLKTVKLKSKSTQKQLVKDSGLKVEGAEYALIPVNYSENHWALLLWKIPDGQLFYFDSFNWTAEKSLFSVEGNREACQFLTEELSKKVGRTRKVEIYDVKVPAQTNKEDCGPLVLVMMEKLIEDDGKIIKNLNTTNCKKLLCNWFDPADAAYFLRKKLLHI